MATYATNTNPFINAESSNRGLGIERGCCKKDAPGMAKPHNYITDGNKLDGTNLLLSDHDTETTSLSSDVSSCCKEKLQVVSLTKDCCININNDKQKGHNQEVATTTNDELDPIKTICNHLVDTAVQRELISSSEKNIVELVEGTSTLRTQSKHPSLDNEDEIEEEDEPLPVEKDSRKQQHIELIKKLRLQLRDLEKYAYERGELEQAPPSLLAERQTVILDTLKDKLSLNICMEEFENLNLDDLKKQVDKEIHGLIDPLITKEHLLSQLKTQLTDLERYVSHLHGTLDKRSCSCHLHGCSSKSSSDATGSYHIPNLSKESSLLNNDSLPKTSRLIRGLITQLICSDIKLQKSAEKESELENQLGNQNTKNDACVRQPQFHDGAAWSLHLDRVILATDSLVNLFTLEPKYHRSEDKPADDALVESVVRRQLVPAIRDLLSYGLLDPTSATRFNSYTSLLFDPYYLLSSFTCFPRSQKSDNATEKSSLTDRVHVWNIIEEYYRSRNEPGFKNSSVKTLSQSFNLGPSMNGPIKITSKQALLIAVDDIIETLSKCKPDGPESHFRAFIYSALNRSKLVTWLRLIFKNKSIVRNYYHNFSFVSQIDKMDKFLKTIEPLNQIAFNLCTDVESIEQFVSAF